MLRKLALISVLIVAMLAIVVPASAGIEAMVYAEVPDICLDYVNLGEHAVCLLGADDNEGMTTWTYAVRTNTNFHDAGASVVPEGEEGIDAIECHPVLDQLTLSVCPNEVTDPADGSTYLTPASYGALTNDVKAGVAYLVTHLATGTDPVVGELDFENQNYYQALGYNDQNEWGIFQFTQPTQTNPGFEPNDISLGIVISHGNPNQNTVYHSGQILGPVCDGTSPVEIASFTASHSLFARIASWLGLK